MRKLGASPAFLNREVRSQCSNVFRVPALVAMTAIYLIFVLLLYGNDGKIVFSEIMALAACLGIEAALGGLTYLVYRSTVAGVCKRLFSDCNP